MQKLIDIVLEASKLMCGCNFNISQKEGFENIVTTADVAVQTYLCQQLKQIMPDSSFICEEEDAHDIKHNKIWIIDPIDGTANFSRGIDQCAISVGLKDDEGMLMAVVYLPRTNELFSAQRGKGAYLNGKPIKVSDRPFENGIMCTALPVYHKEYTDVCSEIITDVFHQCNDIRRFGAAAPELCYMAMGRIELYFEYLLSAWDFAAASLILTEAGGVMCDLQGYALDATKPSGVLAANKPESLRHLLHIVKNHL